MRTTMTGTTETRVRTTSTGYAGVGNIGLWLLQVLLAALFAWHGQFMAFPPAEMAEMLAAVGLLLPGITHILPRSPPGPPVG